MAHFFRGVFSRLRSLQTNSTMIISKRTITDQVMPTDFQRKILVWTKFYPNVEAIPKYVNRSQVKKAIDLFRIRINVMMMVMTVGGCIGVVIYGKYLKEGGDSLTRRGQEDIHRWREEKKLQDEANMKNE